MSKQRLIVRVPGGLFGLTKLQRNHIQAEILEWYENGTNPLLIGNGWEVYGFTDEWEHMIDVTGHDRKLLSDALEIHEAEGWQLCGVTDSEAGNLLLIFKRPKPLEGSDDE